MAAKCAQMLFLSSPRSLSTEGYARGGEDHVIPPPAKGDNEINRLTLQSRVPHWLQIDNNRSLSYIIR